MKPVKGFYGEYGGQFVTETLIPSLDRLEEFFRACKADSEFNTELNEFLSAYAGRPTPVYYAKNISVYSGVEIYLKREDLLHTGAHKINNAIGQALLAKKMGKTRVIAETGAGQHGVASATAAALFDLDCTVYMGEVDAERQKPNVKKMELLGAEVVKVTEGQKTLKEAVTAALRDWVSTPESTHYIIGSVVGPHPFPEMVAFFQSVIGRECKDYFIKEGFMPDSVVACVGGGSNAIGIFSGFLDSRDVELIGVEAGGRSDGLTENAATLSLGSRGILQGTYSYMLQDDSGFISDVHSISAGLDYAGVGPQHSFLKDSGRVKYVSVGDGDALNAFRQLSKREGIIPALESSHALAYVFQNTAYFKGRRVLVNLSGRGDKDFPIIESLQEGV